MLENHLHFSHYNNVQAARPLEMELPEGILGITYGYTSSFLTLTFTYMQCMGLFCLHAITIICTQTHLEMELPEGILGTCFHISSSCCMCLICINTNSHHRQPWPQPLYSAYNQHHLYTNPFFLLTFDTVDNAERNLAHKWWGICF